MNRDDPGDGPERAVDSFDGYAGHSRRRAARRLERALLAAEQGSGSAGTLAELFAIARDSGMEPDPQLRSRLVRALKHLYAVKGPEGGEGLPGGVSQDDVIALIEELDDPDDDSDPIRSRIMTAQVYSRVDGRVAQRGTALQEAYALCRPGPDRIEVGMVLAQFHVDTGAYRRAKRILAECARTIGTHESHARMLPELAVCRGSLLFAQGRLREARHCFSDALVLLERCSRSEPERPGVKAHHYLGKIHALYGRYERAVRELVRAEALLKQRGTDDLRQSGHNHSRLGEVLHEAGSPDALWHANRARDLFLRAGDESSGRGVQEGASGDPAEPVEHRVKRYEVRQRVAWSNRHWRSAVIVSSRLMLIRARQGDLRSATSDAWRMLNAGTRLVLGGGVFATAKGVVELAAAHAARTVRRRRAARLSTPLRCPCGHCRSPAPGAIA